MVAPEDRSGQQVDDSERIAPRGVRESGGLTRLVLLGAERASRSMTPTNMSISPTNRSMTPRALFPVEVIASLRAGGVVIFPTDTLYGVGVDPRSETGLARLLASKGRDRGKPIPLLLSGAEEVERWARHVPAAAARLMARFWPGALTLVLPADPGIHPAVTGGGDTVGLRVPDHPVPRALAAGLSGAVTGTSANRSGKPGAWGSAEEIVREFTGDVDWVLWGGAAAGDARREGGGISPGSTVVRMVDDRPVLLREGVLPFRDIVEFLERG